MDRELGFLKDDEKQEWPREKNAKVITLSQRTVLQYLAYIPNAQNPSYPNSLTTDKGHAN